MVQVLTSMSPYPLPHEKWYGREGIGKKLLPRLRSLQKTKMAASGLKRKNTLSPMRSNSLRAGAIIGDGDRKSWDARGPMIWDNFSIYRTNCAILTSYIRPNPRTCRGFSRGCCHVAESNVESCYDSLADFSQGWQGIRNQGSSMYFYAPS